MSSFDINTYDMLQRSISTAEALEQLGAEPATASLEAAESVLDEQAHSVSEMAYSIEWIAADGPPVDASIVTSHLNTQLDEGESPVTATVEALQVAVLASATEVEVFDLSPAALLDSTGSPQEEYDAKPEKIVALFSNEAQNADFPADGGEYGSPERAAAAAALSKHQSKLATLTFTSLCIAVEHLVETYDIDPVVLVDEEIRGGTLNDVGQKLFEVCLAAYLIEQEE